MKEVGDLAKEVSGRRAFQALVVARAKALNHSDWIFDEEKESCVPGAKAVKGSSKR